MAKVYKNFKKLPIYTEEFQHIKLKDDDVFIDQPICICDYEREYKRPVIVSDGTNTPVCLEETELLEQLKDTTRYYFNADKDGNLIRATEGKYTIDVRIKNDVDISLLKYADGKIILSKKEEKEVVK